MKTAAMLCSQATSVTRCSTCRRPVRRSLGLGRSREGDQGVADIVARGFDAPTVKRVIAMVDRNEYKRRQAPPGIKITPRAFGRDRRLPISSRWRETAPPETVSPALPVRRPVEVRAADETTPDEAVSVSVPERQVDISTPITVAAQIDASRPVTKTIVTQRKDDGTLVATVTEDPQDP